MPRGAAVAVMALTLLADSPAGAQEAREPSPADAPTLSASFRTSVKSSLLVSRTPQLTGDESPDTSVTSFWRVRLEPTLNIGHDLTLTIAYEQRLRVFTQSGGPDTGILPSDVSAPFRIRPLDWSIARPSGSSWRHEFDRASVAWRTRKATVTVGRQAVGWGRGVLFGAVDLFAPFSPLEADRDWRRGIDALRIEVPLAERTSADAVVAFGESMDESIVAGRVRGYARDVDIEVVGGRRARDGFAGATTSAAIGDAEVHGEAVVFHARDRGPVGDQLARTVTKLVAGASYRVGLGPGIFLMAEYHYSGFGLTRPEDIPTSLASPPFLERFLRGDTQTLGRHATAVTASSEISPELAVGAIWLHNPADRSGVAAPTVTITFSDRVSLLVSGYFSYGRPPRSGVWRSEHGAAGTSAFTQLRLYL